MPKYLVSGHAAMSSAEASKYSGLKVSNPLIQSKTATTQMASIKAAMTQTNTLGFLAHFISSRDLRVPLETPAVLSEAAPAFVAFFRRGGGVTHLVDGLGS